MHIVREGRSGDMGAGHKPAGKHKQSNWDLAGKGKGHGHLKGDLDEKGVKHAKAKSGGTKGDEAVKKRKV